MQPRYQTWGRISSEIPETPTLISYVAMFSNTTDKPGFYTLNSELNSNLTRGIAIVTVKAGQLVPTEEVFTATKKLVDQGHIEAP